MVTLNDCSRICKQALQAVLLLSNFHLQSADNLLSLHCCWIVLVNCYKVRRLCMWNECWYSVHCRDNICVFYLVREMPLRGGSFVSDGYMISYFLPISVAVSCAALLCVACIFLTLLPSCVRAYRRPWLQSTLVGNNNTCDTLTQ